MDIKKLKEEIRLLERKLELLEQINKLQAIPVYPTNPRIYPVWQVYPYPNGGVTTSPCPAPCETTAFPNGSISAYNGSAKLEGNV
jgi:hypothetical protein